MKNRTTIKHLLTLAFIWAIFNSQGQTPVLQWVNQNGSSNSVTTTHISSDAAGNIYSTGFFSGTIDLDPGPGTMNAATVGSSDVFITKTDAAGHFIWGRTYGSSGADEALHIVVVNDQVFVCGFFLTSIVFDPQQPGGSLQSFGDFDAFVLTLDTSGQFTRVAQLGGGAGDIAHSLAVDSMGNIIVVGQFGGTADFDPSPAVFALTAAGTFGSDCFVVKLDQQGQLQWAKQLGGTSSDIATEVSLSNNGTIYIGGHFRATADMDPGPGNTYISSNGGDDAFVVKLDSAGQLLWVRNFGNTGFDLCNSLTSSPQGGVVITGPFQSSIDADPGPGTALLTASGNVSAYLIHLDSAGQFGFARALKGSANVTPRHILTRSDGNIYLSGNHNGTSTLNPSGSASTVTTNGAEDAFLLALDISGNTRWLMHFGSIGSDDALGISIASGGEIMLCGKFAGTCIFDPAVGGPVLTPAASRDGFVLKLADPLITSVNMETASSPSPLFPNPTTGLVYLNERMEMNSLLSLYDQSGHLVWQDQYDDSLMPIDFQQFPAGLYLFEVSSNSGRQTFKLFITD